MQAVRRLDFYPKLRADAAQTKTATGAAVSFVTVCVIVLLIVSELWSFNRIKVVDNIMVDPGIADKLRINFDITFPYIPCDLVSVDAKDISGASQMDVQHDITKEHLDNAGNPLHQRIENEIGQTLKSHEAGNRREDVVDDKPYCGSCYGAEAFPTACCNTCDEVKLAYQTKRWALTAIADFEQCQDSEKVKAALQEAVNDGEGCRMHGHLAVNKVEGEFHFVPSKAFAMAHAHQHDQAAFSAGTFNVSHRINHLSFGESFPGVLNPLDDTDKTELMDAGTEKEESQHQFMTLEDLIAMALGQASRSSQSGGGMFNYYIKIVPTNYSHASRPTVATNQYSVTEHFKTTKEREGASHPGIYFRYAVSPLMVEYSEQLQPYGPFLTNLCAIVGGVFTVAGMLDKLIYFSGKTRQIPLGS